MLKPIEKAKKHSDSITGRSSRISSDLKEILIHINASSSGVIIEIPWEADAGGKYQESITVLAVKITKERLFFLNSFRESDIPCEIKEIHKKGPPRRIEKNGFESILLKDLIKINKERAILGIIRM